MYNHYIPQSDGSYRRNYVPENTPRRHPQRPAPPPPPPQQPPHPPKRDDQKPVQEDRKPDPKPTPPSHDPCPPPQEFERHHEHSSPLSFLKKLLPKDLDSYDMIIIALLLLLTNDDCEGDIAPLLTIALYFLL